MRRRDAAGRAPRGGCPAGSRRHDSFRRPRLRRRSAGSDSRSRGFAEGTDTCGHRTFLLLAGLVPALSACATITRGTEDTFVVETDPAGARVRTSNGLACASTPCALRMDRDSEFVVTIEKEGFETHTASVSHEVADGGAAGMAGNVLVGGLIGVAVDAGSGAMYDLVPNPLRVTLIPASEPRAGADRPRSRTGSPADAAGS